MGTKRIVRLAAALLALGACSKEAEIEPPAELVDFAPTVEIDRVWSASTDGGDDVLRLALRPAVESGRVYAAGHGGDVRAIELESGREIWGAKTDLELSAGPAIGAGLLVLGTSEGGVLALESETGAQRWLTSVGGEVLATPVIAGELVVVRTVDGRLRGLRADNGREAWNYEQAVPRLTLRGNGAPVVSGDMVLAGFDNGKVVALALASGELLWSTTVAPSHGRTEIERLVDIDSPVRVVGDDVFVVGYQGRIAMLARNSGQIWWGRELSSHRGLAVSDTYLYVTLADSTVVALRRRDGTEVWRQEGLLRRSVTAPAMAGDALVVGDFEGYVHWLDPATGEMLARGKSGGGRISNAPIAAGELLLLQTDAGEVQAWRTRPRSPG